MPLIHTLFTYSKWSMHLKLTLMVKSGLEKNYFEIANCFIYFIKMPKTWKSGENSNIVLVRSLTTNSYMVAVHSYFNHSSLTAIFLGQSTKFGQFPPRLAGNVWKLKGINYQELTVLIYTVQTLTIDTLLKWKKSHNEKIATHLLTLLAQHIKNKP